MDSFFLGLQYGLKQKLAQLVRGSRRNKKHKVQNLGLKDLLPQQLARQLRQQSLV
jgi:hypothetical protein